MIQEREHVFISSNADNHTPKADCREIIDHVLRSWKQEPDTMLQMARK